MPLCQNLEAANKPESHKKNKKNKKTDQISYDGK